MTPREPRIGLVLGAGGVIGGAWHAGALAAIERITGWAPAGASHLVGTSAGSVFAALIAGGVATRDLLAPIDGMLDDLGKESSYRHPLTLPVPLPGSPQLSLATLASPHGQPLLKLFGGLLPRGLVSTDPIRRTVRRSVARGWTSHANCWIVCCDYETGMRTVFGRTGAPPAELADAVAASCAIPGFFRPVKVAGRLRVDGGLHSLTNLELLAGQQLDLVLCLSPMSGRATERSWHPAHMLGDAVRALAARQLDEEVATLSRMGTKVLVIEPTAYDLALMGENLMQTRHVAAVAFLAQRSVARQLLDPAAQGLLRVLSRPRSRSARSWPGPTVGVSQGA